MSVHKCERKYWRSQMPKRQEFGEELERKKSEKQEILECWRNKTSIIINWNDFIVGKQRANSRITAKLRFHGIWKSKICSWVIFFVISQSPTFAMMNFLKEDKKVSTFLFCLIACPIERFISWLFVPSYFLKLIKPLFNLWLNLEHTIRWAKTGPIIYWQ